MGGGGAGALMSGRGAADALAKMTQVAGFFFLITSLSLTVLSGAASSQGGSVLDLVPRNAPVTMPAPTPTPTPAQPAHPDPTQSSAPQAAQSQLAAAVLPGPAPASAATPRVVPPSTTAGARAAPLQVRPTQTAVAPLQTATPNRGATTPASTGTQPAARTTTTTTTTHRSGSTTTQAGTQPRLILPTSPGAQALADGQTAPESSNAGVQPVRRQRAGPDQ